MRTTVDIPDDLYRRAKAHAALNGMRLRELIADALESALEARAKGAKPRKLVRFPILESDEPGVLTVEMVNRAREELDDEEARHHAGLE